jgi:hypothetical protein
VNVGTNLLLSANTFLPSKPVLLRNYKTSDAEQVWIISAKPAASGSFYVEASQGGVSLSAPPLGSIWAGNPALCISVKNESRSEWTFVKERTSNAFMLLDAGGRSLSVVGGEDDGYLVVLDRNNGERNSAVVYIRFSNSDAAGSATQLWKSVPVGTPSALVGRLLLPPAKSLSPANVPDGV